jgi:hypothetical protein
MNILLNLAQCKKQSPLLLAINTGVTEVRHYLSVSNVLISSEWKEMGM